MKQVLDLSAVDERSAAMIAQNAEKLAAMAPGQLNVLGIRLGYKGKPRRKKLLIWLRGKGQCIS